MKLQRPILYLMVPLFVVGLFSMSNAQQMTIDIGGGVSQPIESVSENWNTGFVIGTNGFIWVVDKIGVGGRFGYNRWSPEEDAFLKLVADLTDTDLNGSVTIIEIIPSMRVRTNYKSSPVNIFGQGGFGLYVIRTKAELAGVQIGTPENNVFNEGDWIGRAGLSCGAGISLGRFGSFSIDIFPLYNLVFNKDYNPLQYFTGNVAVSFKL